MQCVAMLRRWIAVVGVVVPLAVAALPALAADFDATRDAWLRNRAEMAETMSGLEEVTQQTADATLEYQEVTARLDDARGRLDELRGTLATAVRKQRRADRANDVAIRRLGQATMVTVTLEESLREHAESLEVEIVAVYKYGGSSAQFRGVVEALLHSGSITEFSNVYEQLRNGTESQSRLVDSVTALAERLTEQRAVVEVLQRRTEAANRLATAERRRVAALTREQQGLVESVAADRRKQKRLLAQLEQQEAELQTRAEELQAQSDQLMEELGQYRYVGGAPGSKDLLWPTDGAVTSVFGYRHHPILDIKRLHAGVDIPAPPGQPIYAVADATVSSAGARGGYGNAVVLDHGEGMTSVYAHQSKITVQTGEQVKAGDQIGAVGSTGLSTGPHLHFEIRLGGVPVDPMEWY